MCALIVNWLSVLRLILFSVLHDLIKRSIDLTLKFPQAHLDVDIHMDLLIGFGFGFGFGFDFGSNLKKHVLKLNKSLCELKQSVHSRFEILKSSLETRRCENKISSDPCISIEANSIVIVYVDIYVVFSKK